LPVAPTTAYLCPILDLHSGYYYTIQSQARLILSFPLHWLSGGHYFKRLVCQVH